MTIGELTARLTFDKGVESARCTGLMDASYTLCPHARTKSYNDPRDPGARDCLDCGKSW